MPLLAWRLLLPRIDDSHMDLDEELFQAMLALEQQREDQTYIRWNEASSWSLNQPKGTLTLYFDDDTEITAKVQIIGTFDGDTFMWSFDNPSILDGLKQDAIKLRDYGSEHGWPIFSESSFSATVRDGYAIAALANKLFDGEGVYAGEFEGTASYLVLRQVPALPLPCTEQPEFGPKSMMESLTDLLASQMSGSQISLSELREVENICRRGYVLGTVGQHSAATESFDEAWAKLGDFASEQEPAGWIKLAKGNSLFLASEFALALTTLQEAEHLYSCPDLGLLYLRMGQCYFRTGDIEKSAQTFARVFVANGKEGLAELSAEELKPFEEHLAKLRKKKEKEVAACKTEKQKNKKFQKAAATVSCLIGELHAFEMNAHKLQEKAGRSRKKSIEEAQLEADDQINTLWTWLLSVWCAPHRSPLCQSIQFPPAHDPEAERIDKIYDKDNGTVAVETSAEDSFGAINCWRYELEESEDGFLLKQLYSVWDDEEYQSI